MGAGVLGLHPHYYALVQELPTKRMGQLSGLLAASAWFTAGFVQAEVGAYVERTKSYDAPFLMAGIAPVVALVALVLLWKPKASGVA